MKREKIVKEIIKLFCVFFIGSVIGCLWETAITIVEQGEWISRQGLVIGPFIPVYGIGLVFYYVALARVKDDSCMKIFIYCAILGGIVEYLCSYVQEKCFGTVSWDYSNLLFNIQGRTSLYHCAFWGVGGIIFKEYIMPIINKIDKEIKKKYFQYVVGVLAIFMTVNITLSCMAGSRQKERVLAIPANSRIDTMLDTFYPDEKMDKIFSNKLIKIEKKMI